jgi:hypothetical protein
MRATRQHCCTHTSIHAYMHTCIHGYRRYRVNAKRITFLHASALTRTHAYMLICLYAYILKCSHAYLLTRVRTSTRRRRQEDAAMCMRAYALRLSRSARNRTSLIPASSHEHAEARSACTLQRARAFGYHACTISRRAGRTKRVVADALTPSSCGA